MRKIIITLAFLLVSGGLIHPTIASAAYNFGDFNSETLTTKAWNALRKGDLQSVLAYTSKCLELYGSDAQKMQSSLNEYPGGTQAEISKYWALNDVATSLFIQGEAYRKSEKKEEALTAYQRIINSYSYGQTWDSKGWFWKPAEAANAKIALIESGSTAGFDFGDHTSTFLLGQAWKALGGGDPEAVIAYADKVFELYGDKAKTMQASLTEYAWESEEDIFSNWALNDVGTAIFIKGEAFKKAGEHRKAQKAYNNLVNNFYYAQCWDPNGWFWKPAETAQKSLDELGEF